MSLKNSSIPRGAYSETLRALRIIHAIGTLPGNQITRKHDCQNRIGNPSASKTPQAKRSGNCAGCWRDGPGWRYERRGLPMKPERFHPAAVGMYPSAHDGMCGKCGHFACVCIIRAKHKKKCRFRVAATCAIGIPCDHGRDCCPICDPCTCGATA